MDNIRDLLLNHNLDKSKPADAIRQIAKEQTLTALRSLDAGRNVIVLHFLQDSHLVGVQDSVINLSNADLSNDNLSGADMSGVDLVGSSLIDTRLDGANLNGADLYNADLGSADLSGAILSNAYLFDAILTGADLNGARLSNATLTGAFLDNTTLSHANLTGAHLSGADLSGSRLEDADLSGATLFRADLSSADLSGADLSSTELVGNLVQQQLDKVKSCVHASLPKKLKCHRSARIVLTYWYTESEIAAPVIAKLIRQFEHQNPYIKINAIRKPFLQTQAAFATATHTGKAPDVLLSDIGWVSQFASQHYLLNIESYLSQSDRADYLSTPLQYDNYSGHLYGLPQVTDVLALLYNKAELRKAGITRPPATMAEFERDAISVTQRKVAEYGFETNGEAYYSLPFLYAFGGGMFDRHRKILVNDSASVTGLEFLLRLQNIDKVMPANVKFSDGPTNLDSDFLNGKTAMIFDGPWSVSNIWTGSAFSGNHSNLGIADIPTGPTGQTGSPLGGQSYVISVGTAHPFEAYSFISFMSSAASQVLIAKENHTMPTRRSAYQGSVSSDPVIKDFVSVKKIAVGRPAIPQSGHLFDAFDPNIADALDGVESPATALNAVAEAWKQLLATP